MNKFSLSLLLAGAFFTVSAMAQTPPSPLGLWRTIDDKEPGKVKSLVRVTESGGVYSGRIEEMFDKGYVTTCVKCPGDRANQPVKGLVFMTGFHRDGDGETYNGGEILDPETGSTYKSRMTPSADNKTMDVRGYIGIPLLGRTQIWQRAE